MIPTSPMRGFTLVETLVAITVIATAMVGPLYAVQQSLNASRTARDQLVASSLAQEGIEYVRSIRDNNYIYALKTGSTRSWLYGVDESGPTNCVSAACVVDPTQGTQSRSVSALYLSTNGLYNQQGSGTATTYVRTVQLQPVPTGVTVQNATEAVLTVTVTWVTKGKSHSMTITERLHNWL